MSQAVGREFTDTLDTIINDSVDALGIDDTAELEEEEEEVLEEESEEEATPKVGEPFNEVRDRLKETDPAAYALLVSQNKARTQMSQDLKEYKTQLDEIIQTIAQQKDEAPTEDPLKGLTDRDQQLLDAYIENKGVLTKDEQEVKDMMTKQAAYVAAENQKGISTYGDTFGALKEDGTIDINPDMQDKIDETLSRLEDGGRGVTPLDLFRLAAFDELIENAKSEGTTVNETPAQEKRREKVTAVKKGNVVSRSSARSGSKTKLKYDPEKDSVGDVYQKALALSARELRGQ